VRLVSPLNLGRRLWRSRRGRRRPLRAAMRVVAEGLPDCTHPSVCLFAPSFVLEARQLMVPEERALEAFPLPQPPQRQITTSKKLHTRGSEARNEAEVT